jgi:SNF2 family DNA or RNA helicase
MQAHIEKQVLNTTLFIDHASGNRIGNPATLIVSPSEIEFLKSPFHLKNEIKAMQGARWLGFRRENPKKVWTVDNCPRNWMQIKYLMGQNPYEWFDRELINYEYRNWPDIIDPKTGGPAEMMDHQKFMTDTGLTYHYQIWGAEMGTGKTLSAQMLMEMSGAPRWFWIGPLKSLENIEREWEKWGLSLTWCKPKTGKALADAVRDDKHNIYLTTYERVVKYMTTRELDDPIPMGVICDESSRLKSPTAQRSKAAQDLGDMIRYKYGVEAGYFIEMSGTPSPKSPLDWWKQCEIVWPGFLKEGSKDQLEKRLAFMRTQELPDNVINVRVGWKDDERKCVECGLHDEVGPHVIDEDDPTAPVHDFKASFNEVAYMYERLEGLVTIIHKKDVLQLPDKVYEVDYCKPSPSTLRVAKTLAKTAPNVMTGITWLRELSDGFMYKEVADGVKSCKVCAGSAEAGRLQVWFDPARLDQPIEQVAMLDPEYVKTLEEKFIECPRCGGTQQTKKMKRIAREVPCPKEAKLKARLGQCEETGRIVIFAGFQGSVDRIRGICHKAGWDVVQCDGRGWQVSDKTKKRIATDKPLDYWADLEHNQNVAFIGHPMSGGLSLNLTESRMTVFWSNDFNPESRSQAEDRIHRKGMDENKGCKIVDIFHLPSDEKVRDILRQNRKLELMTMGDLTGFKEE